MNVKIDFQNFLCVYFIFNSYDCFCLFCLQNIWNSCPLGQNYLNQLTFEIVVVCELKINVIKFNLCNGLCYLLSIDFMIVVSILF